MTMSTWVYGFGAGRADGTAKMRTCSAARAPTSPRCAVWACRCRRASPSRPKSAAIYYDHDRRYPTELAQEVRTGLRHVEETAGARLGDPERPLLVSVRSGAPVSMPGMMDTVLNLGLNDRTVEGLAQEHRRSPLRL